MGTFYKTREDAEFRLHGTIVGYNGSPVLVNRVRTRTHKKTGEEIIVLAVAGHPFGGTSREIRLDDPGFDKFRPVKLGFLNFFERNITSCSWAERAPVRRSKQGLAGESFRCSTLLESMRLELGTVQSSEGFLEMIEGRYPSYDEAIDRLVPNSAIAVSRQFAVSMGSNGMISLHYGRENVGVVFRGQLYLRSDQQYLLESIIEEPNLPSNVEIM